MGFGDWGLEFRCLGYGVRGLGVWFIGFRLLTLFLTPFCSTEAKLTGLREDVREWRH